MCVLFVTYTCVRPHLYVKHLIHMCVMACCIISRVWHDSYMCVTWLIHVCVTPHTYVCNATFIYEIPHSFVWSALSSAGKSSRDTSSLHSVLLHMCDMPHSYVCDTTFSAGRSSCDTSSLPFIPAGLLNQWNNCVLQSRSSRRHQVDTTKYCNTLQYTGTLCSKLQHTATH